MPSRYKKFKISIMPNRLLWCYCFFNLLPSHAFADEQDILKFTAGVHKAYYDNLFRQNTNEISDQATISTLGVSFNKTYALQRFLANFTYYDSKYQKNDFLDNEARNHNLAWQWSLTPNLTGVLSSTRSEGQISFNDLQVPVRNLVTTTENVFRAEYSPHKVLSLIMGYSEITNKNSRQFNAIASNERVGLDYGVQYNFSSGSYITLLGHRRQGTFIGRPINNVLQFDNGFTDYEYDLEFFSEKSGKSNLSVKLGYVEREHDNFSLRDYQGYIGSANYEILLTGKLKSNFVLARSIRAFETINSTYGITDSFTTSLDYEISEKIQAGLDFRLAERDFEGRGQFDTSGRVDKEHSYGANIRWQPSRNIGVSLTGTKYSRNSTLTQFDYDSTVVRLNLDFRI